MERSGLQTTLASLSRESSPWQPGSRSIHYGCSMTILRAARANRVRDQATVDALERTIDDFRDDGLL